MKLNFKAYFFIAGIVLGLSLPAAADGWDAHIQGSDLLPESVIAVNKDEQRMYLLVHKSPIKSELSFVCSTGKVKGNKLVEGDKKTPEGVYFTTGKRTGLTDYKLYGDMAFPLDFPNPVDRINEKSGYGIWIHGRGKQLVARDTQGCVALANSDIASLDKEIAPGFPVVIGESVEWSEAGENSIPLSAELKDEVLEWADNWQAKKESFFSFYDAKRFGKAENISFRSFRRHKEGIFSRTPWIDVEIFDIKALQGPDYWVTWFNQFYRSRNYVSSTCKRLYWQKVDGNWKIVGVTFGPRPGGLEKKYLERKRDGLEKFIESWRKGWISGKLDDYLSFYDKSAIQGNRKGISDIRSQKSSLWDTNKPALVDFGRMNVKMCPEGFRVRFTQEYADSTGYKDYGVKVLVLRPEDQSWRIINEQWSRLK